MKKFLLILFIIVALLIGLGLAILWQSDYGYVLISNGQWTSERSLSQFVVLILAAFVMLYIITRLLLKVFFFPSALEKRSKRKQKERASKNLILGLINIIEGRPKKAEKILLKNIEHSDTKLINYLLAARAAQLEDADDRRDEYLKLAHSETPQADMAIGLTQAELQLAHNQTEQALATLSRLREIDPKHVYVLKLLVRLYLQLKEWDKLVALLPDIRKYKIIPDEKLINIERSAYSAFLKEVSKLRDTAMLRDHWQQIPRHYRNDGEIVQVYVECLLKTEQGNEAEALLRKRLNQQWDEALIILYGLISSENQSKQLDYAESWKKDHGRSPALLLTLARLCYRLRLWGKSRVYFETSIAIKPSIEAYNELGELLTVLGETENAHLSWQQGIKLAAKLTSRRSILLDQSTLSETMDIPANGIKY